MFGLEVFLNTYRLFNKRIVLGLSGGIDSIVLFDCLVNLRKEFTFELFVCHVNHGIRFQSDEEESFITQLCDKYNIPHYIQKINVLDELETSGESIEMVSHRLRKKVFHNSIEKFTADAFFTAHHKDDNIETIFIRLGFGTGIEGIQGLSEHRGEFYKPLLNISRSEIERYQKKKNLKFFEDYSNKDESIPRNYWRNTIFPQIKDRFGSSYFENLLKTVKNINWREEDYDLLNIEIEKIDLTKSYAEINKNVFNTYLSVFKKKFIERIFEKMFQTAYLLTKTQFDTLLEILNSGESKKTLHLTKSIYLETYKNLFYIYKKNDLSLYQLINRDSTTRINNGKLCVRNVLNKGISNPNCEYIDSDLVEEPLKIRYIAKSDTFSPLGLGGKQSLNRFLKSRNIPSFLRPETLVLCSGEKIIWVIGMRLDAYYKVTDKTKNYLELSWKIED